MHAQGADQFSLQAAAAGPATMAAKPAPGVYMPPFKLAQLMAAEAAQDKTGPQYQRLTWDALRKSINALVNKVTAQNLKLILHELFHEVRCPPAGTSMLMHSCCTLGPRCEPACAQA